MWSLAEPWWELVLRAVVVYVFLLVLLRVTGKRQVGQLAPFDLVLLLVISNTVQNAMNAGDNSVTAGLLLAVSVVVLNMGMARLTFRSKRLAGLVEGEPQVLVHNGKLNSRLMDREKLTQHELMAALRRGGCLAVDEVHAAILENDGCITVVPRAR
jgi:uncharacterized membrane protein YcaP (DUF421 family)